jgi:hypothetical protein
MLPEHNEGAFDWISQGRDKRFWTRPPEGNGGFIPSLIPPIFQSYVKLLHSVKAHYEFIDNPLSESENAILRIPPCEPLKSFVELRRAETQGTRIRWKVLAELLDVPFVPEINLEWFRGRLTDTWCWPRLLSGPADGYLIEDECRALSAALKLFAGQQDCFFRFSDILLYSHPGQPQLFKGNLDEVADFQIANRGGFEYWWPSDRSWCVCSEYDLPYTIIGGRSGLISALLLDGTLECVEINPRTRIDVFVPMP